MKKIALLTIAKGNSKRLKNKNNNKNYIFGFIKNFFKTSDNIKDFWDPYPTSIRLINLIKFVSKFGELA